MTRITGWPGIPLLVAAAFLLGACSDEATAPVAAPPAPAPLLSAAPQARVVPGRYIVVFRDEVRNASELSARLAATHGAKLHYTYQHALKGFAATLPTQAVEALRHDPNVAYIQPDQTARLLADTQTSAPWALDRIDQRDLPLNATYTYTNKGQGVKVYVIDSGIETTHPQFGGRATFGFDACYIQCNDQDGLGHGTRVAGIVGSSTYGVAKGVSLVSVRVMSNAGPDTVGTTSSVMAGVNWVTQQRQANPTALMVANMSVAFAPDVALDAAVRNSIASGVTYVIGAGNDGEDACNTSPARVSEALTVGATTQYDGMWGLSNYGPCVDLYAPGSRVKTTTLNGGTTTTSGTSLAAPHVAGYVARYLQMYPGSAPSSIHLAMINISTKGRIIELGPNSNNRLLYTVYGSETGRPIGCCL